MPFTFCHPAILLPFSYLHRRISMAGLVVGSMIPDFEYFMRMKVRSVYSHTWPGLFWFDLPLGLIVLFVYQLLVKDKLIDNLPAALNRRFSKYKTLQKQRYSPQYLMVAVLCILTGAATHIFWDAFTHPEGSFVLLIPALSDTMGVFHYHVSIYKILQHASSIVGAVAIITTIYYLPLGAFTKNDSIISYWITVMLVVFIVFGIRLCTGLSLYKYGEVIVTLIAGGLLGLMVASAQRTPYFKSRAR